MKRTENLPVRALRQRIICGCLALLLALNLVFTPGGRGLFAGAWGEYTYPLSSDYVPADPSAANTEDVIGPYFTDITDYNFNFELKDDAWETSDGAIYWPRANDGTVYSGNLDDMNITLTTGWPGYDDMYDGELYFWGSGGVQCGVTSFVPSETKPLTYCQGEYVNAAGIDDFGARVYVEKSFNDGDHQYSTNSNTLYVQTENGGNVDASIFTRFNFYMYDAAGNNGYINDIDITLVDASGAERTATLPGGENPDDTWCLRSFNFDRLGDLSGFNMNALSMIKITMPTTGEYFFDNFFFSATNTDLSTNDAGTQPINRLGAEIRQHHNIFSNEPVYAGESMDPKVTSTPDSSVSLSSSYHADAYSGYSAILRVPVSMGDSTDGSKNSLIVKPGETVNAGGFFDASEFEYINFYRKDASADSGNASSAIVALIDNNGTAVTATVAPPNSANVNQWVRCTADLSAFSYDASYTQQIGYGGDAVFDMANIAEIRILERNAGDYYIDSIFFSDGNNDKNGYDSGCIWYNHIESDKLTYYSYYSTSGNSIVTPGEGSFSVVSGNSAGLVVPKGQGGDPGVIEVESDVVEGNAAQSTKTEQSIYFTPTDNKNANGYFDASEYKNGYLKFYIYNPRGGDTTCVTLVDADGTNSLVLFRAAKKNNEIWSDGSTQDSWACCKFTLSKLVNVDPNNEFDWNNIAEIRLGQWNESYHADNNPDSEPYYFDTIFFSNSEESIDPKDPGNKLYNPVEDRNTMGSSHADSAVFSVDVADVPSTAFSGDEQYVKMLVTGAGAEPGATVSGTSRATTFLPQDANYKANGCVDLHAYKENGYLIFYIRDTQGTNTVHVTIIDAYGNMYANYFDTKAVKNEWTRMAFKLSDANNNAIDWTNIKEIRLGEWNPGTYYIDALFLSNDANATTGDAAGNMWFNKVRSERSKIDSGDFRTSLDLGNGNYVMALIPSLNGYNTVTVSQTIENLDPNYTYRIGAYIKTIGSGVSTLTAVGANTDKIYFADNFSTTGNGVNALTTFSNDAERSYATQQWQFSTVLVKPDAEGKVTLTFEADSDGGVEGENKDKFNYNYMLFVDNLNIAVYKKTQAEKLDMDVTYYDYSYWDDEYARFFEFVWNDKESDGAHSKLDQGMVNGVLDEEGNIVFTDFVERYNLEYYTDDNKYKYAQVRTIEEVAPVLLKNCDTRDSMLITADLLNGEVEGVDGLFRSENKETSPTIRDTTLTFYKDSTGAFVYDSNLLGQSSPSAEHGYANLGSYPGGFFPLDNIASNAGTPFDAEGLNHVFHFGMTMESDFYLDYETDDEQSLIFQGDDDFWLFVDDVLIIDGGGAHRPLEEATLNFNTNSITITEFDKDKETYNKSIFYTAVNSLLTAYGYAGLEDNFDFSTPIDTTGLSADDIASINGYLAKLFGKNVTLTNNSGNDTQMVSDDHSFKIFYMERCTEASDLKLTLNLGMPEIEATKTGLNVAKQDSEYQDSLYVPDGGKVEYTIDIINSGAKTGKHQVTDTVPNGTSYVEGSLQVFARPDAEGTWAEMTKNVDYTGGFDIDPNDPADDNTLDLTLMSIGHNQEIKIIYVITVDEGEIQKNGSSFINEAQIGDKPIQSNELLVNPIAIEKSVTSGLAAYKPGDTVEYTIEVTNNGKNELLDIIVSDSRPVVWQNPLPEGFTEGAAGTNTVVIDSLAPGEANSKSITCTYVLTGEDYLEAKTSGEMENIAYAEAVFGSEPLKADDDADVSVSAPVIDVEIDKTVSLVNASGEFTDGEYFDKVNIKPGEKVWYKLVVTNNSAVDLENVVAADQKLDWSETIALLEAGKSETFYIEATPAAERNGQLVITSSYDNTATVEASYDNGNVTESNLSNNQDDASVGFAEIKVVKDAPANADSLVPGNDAVFTIKVTNTGSETLTGIVVTDDKYVGELAFDEKNTDAGVTKADVTINTDAQTATINAPVAPGKTVAFTFTYYLEQSDVSETIDNVAEAKVSVDGGDPVNPGDDFDVSDDDNADITVGVPDIDIDIEKTVSTTGADGSYNDVVTVKPGETVYYRIKVTNNSPVALTDVDVTDAKLNYSGKVNLGAKGSANESVIINVPATELDADLVTDGFTSPFVNTAKAEAEYQGKTDEATDNATVKFVDVQIVKNPPTDYEKYISGQTAVFTVTVTNTGSETLTNLVVTDDHSGQFSFKETDSEFANIGNVDTTNGNTAIIEKLESGKYVTLEFEYTVTDEDVNSAEKKVVNTATVTQTQHELTESDDAEILTAEPGIEVEKWVSLMPPEEATEDDWHESVTVTPGTTVYFREKVTNNGGVTNENTSITDNEGKQLDDDGTLKGDSISGVCGDGSYEPGEYTEWIYSGYVAGESITSGVTANAVANGKPISDTDSVDIKVVNLAIDKKAPVPTKDYLPRETAVFTIEVINTGDEPLTGITVSDDRDGVLAFDLDNTTAAVTADDVAIAGDERSAFINAPVAPGEIVAFTFTYTVNEDADPGTIRNTATADVTVKNDVSGNEVELNVSDYADINVLDPNLSLTITKLVSTSENGPFVDRINIDPVDTDTVYYQITVKNTSLITMKNIVVTDDDIDMEPYIITSLAANAEDIRVVSANVADMTGRDYSDVFDNKAVASFKNASDETEEVFDYAYVGFAAIEVRKNLRDDDPQTTEDNTFLPEKEAVFTIEVENTGSVSLTGIEVSDNQIGTLDFDSANTTASVTENNIVYGEGNRSATINAAVEPGEVVAFTFTYVVGNADIAKESVTNVADATVTVDNDDDPDNNSGTVTVEDDDNETIYIEEPTIDISVNKLVSKTGEDGTYSKNVVVKPGDMAYYMIVVTNESPVTLYNVAVNDSIIGYTNTIPVLGPKGSENDSVPLTVSKQLTATIVTDGFDEPFDNTVFATATYQGKPTEDNESGIITVTKDSTASVGFVALELEKNPPADKPAGYKYVPGETANFTVTVRNTGSENLTNLEVTDSRTGIFSFAGTDSALANDSNVVVNGNKATIAELEPGKYVTLTFEYAVSDNDVLTADMKVVNTATVTQTEHGLTDSDDAEINTAKPGIAVVKQVSIVPPGEATEDDWYDSVTVTPGTIVYFREMVTNNGGVTNEKTSITDNEGKVIGGDASISGICGDGSYAPEEHTEWIYSWYEATESEESPVTATATANGKNISDIDSVDIKVVNLTIEKDAPVPAQDYLPGDEVNFTITVTNTGFETLTNIAVTDSRTDGQLIYTTTDEQSNVKITGINTAVISELEPGESETLTFRYEVKDDDAEAGVVENSASAHAEVTDEESGNVIELDPSDDAQVNVLMPNLSLDIDKQVSTSKTGPFTEKVTIDPAVTDTVYYQITVENTSSIAMKNIVVSDSDIGMEPYEIARLEAGGKDTRVVTATDVAGGDYSDVFRNTASASFTDHNGDPAEVVDYAYVGFVDIAIDKQAPAGTFMPDEDAVFTITVTNTGSESLYGIEVTDKQIGILAFDPANTTAEKANSSNVVISENKQSAVINADIEPGEVVAFTFTYKARVSDIDTNVINVAETTVTVDNDDIPDNSSGTVTVKDNDNDSIPVGKPNATLYIDKTVATSENGEYSDYVAVKPGDDVWFKIVVTNDSVIDMENIVVSDSDVNMQPYTIDKLEAGEDHTKTFKVTLTEDIVASFDDVFTNTAYADYVDSDGESKQVDDSADVGFVAIEIVKTALDKVYTVGQTVEFTITVTNTGMEPLDDVVVEDDAITGTLAYLSDTADAVVKQNVVINGSKATINRPIAPGESVTLSFTHVITEEDAKLGKVDNTATVSEDTYGLAEEDDASAVVKTPALKVTKVVSTVNPVSATDADWSDSVTADPGQTVYFRIRIENTGDAPIANIAIDDVINSSISKEIKELSATWTDELTKQLEGVVLGTDEDNRSWESNLITFTVPDTALYNEQFTNTVSVSAPNPVDPTLPRLTDEDDAKVDTNAKPSISVAKSVNVDKAKPGDTLNYTFVVTNTGNVTLDDVTLIDELLSDAGIKNWPRNIGTLEPGKSYVLYDVKYKVPADAKSGDIIENEVTVVADDPTIPDDDLEDPTSDDLTDTSEVETEIVVDLPDDPVISKSVDKEAGYPGEQVVYTITVTNPSDKDLKDLVVYDAMLGVYWECGTIKAGGTWTAPTNTTCLIPDKPAGTECTNIAYLMNKIDLDPENLEATDIKKAIDKDDATFTILGKPSIEIIKKAGVDEVVPGGEVGYVITVTNTGNVSLTDVVVDDTLNGIWTVPEGKGEVDKDNNVVIDLLDIDDTVMLEYKVSTLSDAKINDKLLNTVTAEADDPTTSATDAPPVKDDDAEEVTYVEAPRGSYTLQKMASVKTAAPGDKVFYTLIVTNTGNITLTDLEVSDPTLGYNVTIDSLEPGAENAWYSPENTLYYVVPDNATTGEYQNTAKVISNSADIDPSEREKTATLGVGIVAPSDGKEPPYYNPSTDESTGNTWVWWTIAAVVLLGTAGYVIISRKRKVMAK